MGRLECNGARILAQHLDETSNVWVHHTPLFPKAILLESAEVTVFLDRLRLLSMGSGTSLTIMTASLGVGASPRSNNKQ
ncbi:hypothetical protein TNCV_3314651 [Trichonephila clavipes]|nr:hypothetical protein TNCV_3314651 [Trichonephila clavipes]